MKNQSSRQSGFPSGHRYTFLMWSLTPDGLDRTGQKANPSLLLPPTGTPLNAVFEIINHVNF